MWFLYQLAMAAILCLAAPLLLARRGGHYLETLPGRLGRRHPPWTHGRPLWIHAVSVGEVGVAATLAERLPADLPLVVTTVTPTGQERARALFASRGLGERSAVTYLPFDLGFCLRRFYRHFDPRALVLVEGDYWPLLMRRARRRSLPIAVVNGRLSGRSFRRLSALGGLAGRLFFWPVTRFGMQTPEDKKRLVALRVPGEKVVVTGNLKFEVPEPPALPELEAAVRGLAAGRPILVAGSTMQGEETQVLEAFRELGGGRGALLVLAPRHPERFDAVAELLAGGGFRCARRSAPGERSGVDVLLLDSLGELSSLYRLAAAAFVGGTLVPTGGHNPLEPARFGVPTAVGPSMENFREMAEQFRRAEAWAQVVDPAALAAAWKHWLEHPAEARAVGRRGAELVERNRGSVASTLELLAPLLRAFGDGEPAGEGEGAELPGRAP